MATREDLFKHFGPQLMEAVGLVILDEVNLLRVQAGLSERTPQQFLDAIESKWNANVPYAWMNEDS